MQGWLKREHVLKKRREYHQTMKSNQTCNKPSQHFIKIVENGVKMKKAIKSFDSCDSFDNLSFNSSISSLGGGKCLDDQSISSTLLFVDTIPSHESCDGTTSLSKSKSFSTLRGMAAKLMPAQINEKDGSLNIASLPAEIACTIESITWLGRHVPRCVMRDLSREVLQLHKNEKPMVIPCAHTYRAALIFIDISGFTKLSLLLDLESLSKFINLYFQKIVDEVTNHGGDVLKFAGDAIFAEWRVNRQSLASKNDKNEVNQCVLRAATCGADIIAKCSDYPILAEGKSATLNVHCGLAFGEVSGVHLGDDYKRREYVLLGKSIDQVTKACTAATYGELVASPEAYDLLCDGAVQKKNSGVKPKKKSSEPVIIASRNQCFFERHQEKRKMWRFSSMGNRALIKKNEFTVPFDKMDVTSLRHLQKLVSFYVHSVVASDEANRQSNTRVNSKITQERHRSEAELRSVYTLFIKPLIHIELTDSSERNNEIFKELNHILQLVTSVLDSFKGHLRQFIVDDKGAILIATFGLRGSTSPNMASERVLPACRAIHYALQNNLGVDNYVGATLGKAYCGVVGSINRHEFAVLGPSVNLSARLLSMPNHPGILVSNSVRLQAMQWGSFLSFPPMKAKGYADPVPVYQPMTATEARWGKANPHFVGRKKEMKSVCKLANEMSTNQGRAKMFLVWGETGSGKSNFLVQTVALIRKILVISRKKVIVTRHICNDGDSLVPFSLFRSIFRDLLALSQVDDNISVQSKLTDTVSLREKDWEKLSLSSVSTMHTVKASSGERLNEICDELGAPKGFLQIVGYHLLGHAKRKLNVKEKAPILDEIMNFMVKVFMHCTSDADLTIVALDDIHQTDSLSWEVIHRIYKKGENVLFVCGSRPLGTSAFEDDDFWKELNDSHKRNDRFQELDLGPLDLHEVAQMISIALSCKVCEVDKQFAKDIFDHTRGMPHFAAQALENCKRKGLYGRLDNNMIGWGGDDESKMNFSSLDELLLQRIDDLDDFTRKTLHLASVLGYTFMLTEIIGLSEHSLSIADEESSSHDKRIRNSLGIAVEEGILDEVVVDCSDKNLSNMQTITISTFPELNDEKVGISFNEPPHQIDLSYQFCHDAWRQKILSLLLDSYKRDIHMHAARTIESNVTDIDESDYRTKMRLFHHLKESRNSTKAADLALNVGKNFAQLGLNLHSIPVYEEALDMWRKNPGTDDESIAGFSLQVVNSINEDDLKSTIKLLTAMGQALGTLTMKIKSARAFESALEVFKRAPSSSVIKDRSIVFPIYSGLFFLLKYGGMVEPSEEKAYEEILVTNFVEETRLNGNPVHYSRALAMLGEFYSRQGQYEDALLCHERLKKIYDVDLHSARVVEAYASDRSAQNYGNCANCLYRLGRVKEALKLCDLILNSIMPRMDPKNVHNSMMMIYPVLWILKNERLPQRAASALEQFVFKPFHLHFGDGGKTFSLVMFAPLRTLFSILMYIEGDLESLDKTLIPLALEVDSLTISTTVDNSFANFARCGSSIGAEVCLLLSNYTDDNNIKKQLIEKGWKLVQIAMQTANKCGSHQTAYIETKPVHDKLALALDFVCLL
mmetsp:Transcript_20356/g.23384  ORF Transcript_20356/g.23384 Transcript_20356/m.23384 type:complete len:1580 (-) Transcript_20356:160-4899(-)